MSDVEANVQDEFFDSLLGDFLDESDQLLVQLNANLLDLDEWAQTLEEGEAAECKEQLENAFAEFFVPSPDTDRHEILVCHGNVIRYLVTKVMKVDPHSWLQISVGNCSITVIRIKADGSFKLLGVGDVGHLPPNLQTGLFNDADPLSVPTD